MATTEELHKSAKEILSNIIYATVATVDESGQPWNSPLAHHIDDDINVYWASWIDSQHSKNISKNPEVFIVIYDSTAPEGKGFAVYILAKVSVLEKEDEILKALSFSNSSWLNKNDAKEFMGAKPRRMYKAIPEKIWMNDDGDLNGDYIDVRKELDLEKLRGNY